MLWRLLLLAVYLLWPALARAEQGPVRLGVFHNPPIITNDHRGPGGIFIDILELTAKREGWRLVYVPGSFADGAERLQHGEIDVLPNAPHTTAREDGMSFSAEPVLSSWGQVYGSESIKDLKDLARVRVATLKGSLLEEALAQAMSRFGMDANIIPFNSYPDAFLAVARGKADAVVANPFTGALQARLNGLHPTPVVLAPYTFRFAVAKGQHKQLLGQLDRTILELKADPSSIYFTRLQELTQAPSFGFPPWFKWVASAAMALVLAGVAWAVTLKRAARQVAASERTQRKLAAELTRISANSLDVIAVLDADFNVIRISRAAETLWGYSASEMQGRPCLDLLHPGSRAAARQVLEGVRSGPPVNSSQARMIRKDGSEAMMLWSLSWSEQERELYAIGRDDSERHALSTRLKAHRAQLEGANQDLLAFARAVSHDLRAPLAAVIGFVGRVLETDGRGLGERSQFLLQRAHAAGTRMDASMVSLLRLARVAEAGVHRRACDITAMCLEVGAALADATPARSVTLSVQPGMAARADKELLRHVVENLLSNAWKFTSGRTRAHVEVGALSNSCEPIFFVKDDGAGFDMQDAGKLFVPFSRLHDRSSFEGTGIGLSIVQRVVHAHGGRVWVEAVQDKGAVFYFTLGLCGGCVEPAPPGPKPTAAPRILEQGRATVTAVLE